MEKQLPQSAEAEAGVLGCILIDPDALEGIETMLRPADFYRHENRLIYAAAVELHKAGTVPDLITIYDALERSGKIEDAGGVAYLSSLGNQVPSIGNAKAYAAIVKRKAISRRMIEVSGHVAGDGYNEREPAAMIGDLRLELDALEKGLGTSSASPLRPLTLAEMRLRPKPTPLIDRFLVAGSVSMCYGPSGDGKTCLLVDEACHVALNRQWMGRKVNGGPVVYIAAEGGSGITGRFDAWIQENNAGEDIPDLYVIPYAAQLLEPAQRADLLSQLRALPRSPVWVIVDTVSQTSGGADENSNSDMAAYVNALFEMRDITGATVTCVHHSLKNGEGYRGASSLIGNVDTVFEVTRAADVSTVKCVKQRDGWEKFTPIRFTAEQIAPDGYEGLTFGVFKRLDIAPAEATLAADDAPLTAKQQAILDTLLSAPAGLAFMDWQRAAGASKSYFNDVVKDFQRRGLVQMGIDGIYTHRSAGWSGSPVSKDTPDRTGPTMPSPIGPKTDRTGPTGPASMRRNATPADVEIRPGEKVATYSDRLAAFGFDASDTAAMYYTPSSRLDIVARHNRNTASAS